MPRRPLLPALLLSILAAAVAAEDEWSLARADGGSLTISRAGEQHWRGTLVYRPAEPDPEFLATPQIPIEITYKSPQVLPPVVLEGDERALSLALDGFPTAVLFSRQTPFPFATEAPRFRSLQHVLYLESPTAYYTFSYDAGLESNRSADEVDDRFSRTLVRALAARDPAAAGRTFLVAEALRFLADAGPLARHHLLRVEAIDLEAGGRTTAVFPTGQDEGSAIPWSRIRLPIEPGRPLVLVVRARAAERQAFVDRVADPIDRPAAGARLVVEEPRRDGTKVEHEAIADGEGRIRLTLAAGFAGEMKKGFALDYPPEGPADHQATYGQILLRWGRPIEEHLDSGRFPIPEPPAGDDDEALEAHLVEAIFAFYDPDVDQFRKGQSTNSTDDLPFFAITLIKWKGLGGELGQRIASGAIGRFRRTYGRLEDYFYFQKYILGLSDAATVRRLLEERTGLHEAAPPNRWTLEMADDLLAAVSLAEMEKDATVLGLVERLADGLVERLGRQVEPSTPRRGRDGDWIVGDTRRTLPHAHAAIALARAHVHLEKAAYLDAAFAQADHLMTVHRMAGPLQVARIEAETDAPGAFLTSQLAAVGLAYDYLARFGARAARCRAARDEIRTAFVRVIRQRSRKLELRDYLEMTRFFHEYYPTGG